MVFVIYLVLHFLDESFNAEVQMCLTEFLEESDGVLVCQLWLDIGGGRQVHLEGSEWGY